MLSIFHFSCILIWVCVAIKLIGIFTNDLPRISIVIEVLVLIWNEKMRWVLTLNNCIFVDVFHRIIIGRLCTFSIIDIDIIFENYWGLFCKSKGNFWCSRFSSWFLFIEDWIIFLDKLILSMLLRIIIVIESYLFSCRLSLILIIILYKRIKLQRNWSFWPFHLLNMSIAIDDYVDALIIGSLL